MGLRFLILAIVLTWVAWLPAGLVVPGPGPALQQGLLYAGGLGPLIALWVVLSSPGQAAARNDFLRRLMSFQALRSPALLLALLLPPVFGLLAALTHAPARIMALEQVAIGTLLATAGIAFVFGPLPEELAWRGYALPVLMERHEPLPATLLLASAWALWHVPLFFMPGTYQAGLVGTAAAGMFFANLYVQSILMSALFLASRSTWSAVIFHWMTNLTGELLKLPPEAEVQRTLWNVLAALLVLVLPPPWGLRPCAGRGRGG